MAKRGRNRIKPVPTAKCDCQWDDHFSDRPVPGTVRHEYGARVARRELVDVGPTNLGKPHMKCEPCRHGHTINRR